MKFSAVAILGLAAVAAAATTDDAAAIIDSAPAPTHTLSAAEKCINACGDNICCKAKCVNVPCPDNTMANDTVDCVSQCPQKDAKQFSACQEGCIKTHFWSATASLPVQTNSDATTTSADATTTDDSATTTDAASSTADSTATSDATASTESAVTTSGGKTVAATKAEASATSSEDSAPTASGMAVANGPVAASVFGAAGLAAALFAL